MKFSICKQRTNAYQNPEYSFYCAFSQLEKSNKMCIHFARTITMKFSKPMCKKEQMQISGKKNEFVIINGCNEPVLCCTSFQNGVAGLILPLSSHV